MTGYGKAEFRSKRLSLQVETTSVNNRFLEYSIRLPKQLQFLEPPIKELISSRVNRGKINLTVNYEDHGFGVDRVMINDLLVDEIVETLRKMKKRYKLSGELEMEDILSFPDIFRIEKVGGLEEKIWPFVSKTINKALDGLILMRQTEGRNLARDISKRLDILKKKIVQTEKLAPQNLSLYREKLAKKIKEVLDNRAIDGSRFEEEVALLAERSDITEECVRLRSHLGQFAADLKCKGPIGKRLNFILQEMHREANTIGAKTPDARIARLALEIKEEVEKIREQVQNVE
jgi:uncharacterized protein (TIGR00255 family)